MNKIELFFRKYKQITALILSIIAIFWWLSYTKTTRSIGQNTWTQVTENVTSVFGDISVINQPQEMHIKSYYDVKKDKVTDEAKSFVNDFYQTINNKNFEKTQGYYHFWFSKYSDIKTYYSKSNWDRFTKCIDDGIHLGKIERLENHDTTTDKKHKRWFSYDITYSIKWRQYKENWEMVWVDEELNWEYKLAWLICNTTWCSSNPLFNYRKHCVYE